MLKLYRALSHGVKISILLTHVHVTLYILTLSPLTGVTIGFTVNYTMVQESVGNVTVMVDILEGTVAPSRTVVVTAMTVDGSAKGNFLLDTLRGVG